MSGLGGLLGSPRTKDALLASFAAGGNPAMTAGLVTRKQEREAEAERARQMEEYRQLQMAEARRQAEEAQKKQAQDIIARTTLQHFSENPNAIAFGGPQGNPQTQLAGLLSRGVDPSAAGGLISAGAGPKPTTLQSNLIAMGIDPQSPQGRQIMLQHMLKPQTAVNVNNAPSLPHGLTFVDPNNPQAGAALLPGYAEAMAALKAAESGGSNAPTAAKETEQQAQGKARVTEMIGEIANQYDTLHKGGGITSVDNSVTSNLLASASQSGAGQSVGTMAGTENQAARNSITMKRPLLVQAIMRATGMSSQQMNSNVELQQMLDMATNPAYGYEVNTQQLKLIDRLYGSGAFGQQQGGQSNNGFRIVP
jgi:hypothetical protein